MYYYLSFNNRLKCYWSLVKRKQQNSKLIYSKGESKQPALKKYHHLNLLVSFRKIMYFKGRSRGIGYALYLDIELNCWWSMQKRSETYFIGTSNIEKSELIWRSSIISHPWVQWHVLSGLYLRAFNTKKKVKPQKYLTPRIQNGKSLIKWQNQNDKSHQTNRKQLSYSWLGTGIFKCKKICSNSLSNIFLIIFLFYWNISTDCNIPQLSIWMLLVNCLKGGQWDSLNTLNATYLYDWFEVLYCHLSAPDNQPSALLCKSEKSLPCISLAVFYFTCRKFESTMLFNFVLYLAFSIFFVSSVIEVSCRRNACLSYNLLLWYRWWIHLHNAWSFLIASLVQITLTFRLFQKF